MFTFDGTPVRESWLRTLGAQLARLGPEDEFVAVDGSTGLVYRAYGTTPDEMTRSSLWQSRRGAWLAFDGRLDNGPELARALQLSGSGRMHDSAIMLEGFERHGQAFVAQIVGDFALAHWDAASRTLTLARDAAGVRALYYHHGPRLFAFASDLGSLLRAAHIDRELDEDHIAAYLGSGGVNEDSTIYRHVRAVEPAQLLSITGDGRMSNRIFWRLPYEADLLRYRNDQEYVDHFEQLFREAVEVRLRTARPVVAELSGGLDSSSVVCMADHLLRTGAVAAASLSTVSRVLDVSKTTDERFRVVVERHCHVETFHQAESELPLVMPPVEPEALHVVSFLAVAAGFETAVCAYMRQLGAHWLLSGFAGDEMFCSTNRPEPGLADLCVHRCFPELHRELTMWSRASKEPYAALFWRSLKTTLPRPWMPMSITPDRWRRKASPWIPPRLRERAFAAVERMQHRLRPYRLPSQRRHAWGYYESTKQIARGERQEFDMRQVTYPCLHRPLVEFLHVVPFAQKLRCGESRSLQRRALRGILPLELLTRRGKGQTTELFPRNFNWQWLSNGAMLGACGYASPKELRRAIAQPRGRNRGSSPLLAISLEAWLRAHHNCRRDPASSNGPRTSTQVTADMRSARAFFCKGPNPRSAYEFPELTNAGTLERVVLERT